MQRMQEPYEKGVANHLDPESWVAVREGRGQALTGAQVGRVLSREICEQLGCRGCSTRRRQHHAAANREASVDPTRSETPRMLGSISTEPGRSHDSPTAEGSAEREGKFKDASPR
jgi:hypothetical protein